MTMVTPEICGYVGGVIASVGFALWGTTKLVHNPNHFGDEEGQYQDYAEQPMKFNIR